MGSLKDPALSSKDLTSANITENVIRTNSHTQDGRLSYILERLVNHLHDFARETRLSAGEWMTAIEFLTAVGQTCTDVRQEFILLSDVLGLSMLVDAIDHPKPSNCTEGTVLGPFHTHEAHDMAHGESMSRDEQGEACLVLCTVKNSRGEPIDGVKIDVWEADSSGRYDVQYEQREGPDGRCVMRSDQHGEFWFKAIKPVPYPIQYDGPVGKLLALLNRHPYRPAHMHFMFESPGYDQLITQLFFRGDPYESTDAVFGVKESLVVEFTPADPDVAERYRVPIGHPVLQYDFILASNEEAQELRDERSRQALAGLGHGVKVINGLPVLDVD